MDGSCAINDNTCDGRIRVDQGAYQISTRDSESCIKQLVSIARLGGATDNDLKTLQRGDVVGRNWLNSCNRDGETTRDHGDRGASTDPLANIVLVVNGSGDDWLGKSFQNNVSAINVSDGTSWYTCGSDTV